MPAVQERDADFRRRMLLVSILSRASDGTASAELLATVSDVLQEVRPLTDLVTVQSATAVAYSITASLTVLPGPDSTVVRQMAQEAVTAYAGSQNRLGHDVTLAGARLFGRCLEPLGIAGDQALCGQCQL